MYLRKFSSILASCVVLNILTISKNKAHLFLAVGCVYNCEEMKHALSSNELLLLVSYGVTMYFQKYGKG